MHPLVLGCLPAFAVRRAGQEEAAERAVPDLTAQEAALRRVGAQASLEAHAGDGHAEGVGIEPGR